jgi:hypothetical protein
MRTSLLLKRPNFREGDNAPSKEQAARLAHTTFGGDCIQPKDRDALDSVINATCNLVEWFGQDFRKIRNTESVFWHNFLVGRDVYDYWSQDPPRLRLLKTFVALNHDVLEDKQHLGYTQETLAEHWCQYNNSPQIRREREWIAKALALKTDPEIADDETNPNYKDARRAEQHRRAAVACQELRPEAHDAYAVTLYFDKLHNLRSDCRDWEDGLLKFETRDKFLEWNFKKLSDLEVVSALQLNVPAVSGRPKIRFCQESYQEHFFDLLGKLIENNAIPAKNDNPKDYYNLSDQKVHDDFAAAKQLLRPRKRTEDPAPFGEILTREGWIAHGKWAHNLVSFQQNGKKFFATNLYDARILALEYAFKATAKLLVIQKAQLDSGLQNAAKTTYHEMMIHLLYAGSLRDSIAVVGQPNLGNKPFPQSVYEHPKRREPAHRNESSALTA